MERTIAKRNLSLLEKKFAQMARRARKLDTGGFSIRVVGEGEPRREQLPWSDKWIKVPTLIVEVTGESPTIRGWKLGATISPQGNGESLVKGVPGVTLPAESVKQWRENPYQCEHCRMDRRRKDTFALYNVETGAWLQIGRNCLADFLEVDPAGLIAYADFRGRADDLVGEEPEFGCGGSREEWSGDIRVFLEWVSAVSKAIGWRSRTEARERMEEGTATSDVVLRVIHDKSPARFCRESLGLSMKELAEKADPDEAEKAMEWARTAGGNDYLDNLGIACRQEGVTFETAGIVASAIPAYRRHLGREMERQAQAKQDSDSRHVGEEKQRLEFSGTVEMVREFESEWGVRTMVKFRSEGNVLIWWASGCPDWIKQGETVRFKGTVKKHDDFRGVAQTVLSRCSPLD